MPSLEELIKNGAPSSYLDLLKKNQDGESSAAVKAAEAKVEEFLNGLDFEGIIGKITKQVLNSEVINALREAKGERGDMGPKPIPGIDFPIPENGINGKDGVSPTPQEIADFLLTHKEFMRRAKGRPGEPGYTPVKGKDYFDGVGIPGKNGSPDTPQQIVEKINSLDGDTKIDARHITGMKTTSAGGSPSRSKAYFKPVTITGTKNGVNKEFYLSEAPKYGTQIFLFLNGQWLSLDTHYSLKGATLTYADSVSAPKSTWQHYAILFRP